MSTRGSEVACLFCGQEFEEQGDLYSHFGSRHLPGNEHF